MAEQEAADPAAAGPKPAASAPAVSCDHRSLLESGTLRLKACKHGPMMFLANDTHIGRSLDLYGEYSEQEIEVFRQYLRPGMVAVDVGANVGTHAVCFAQAVGPSGRVFAFEAQRVLHQILCGNIALSGCRNVAAEQKALGARSGSILVPWLDYAHEANFGGLELGAWTQGEAVALLTLDSYALDACHLIKVDVEGMERDVLEGACSTIAKHQPLLYVENNKPERSKELIQWLLVNHYRPYWHLPPLFNRTIISANRGTSSASRSLQTCCACRNRSPRAWRACARSPPPMIAGTRTSDTSQAPAGAMF